MSTVKHSTKAILRPIPFWTGVTLTVLMACAAWTGHEDILGWLLLAGWILLFLCILWNLHILWGVLSRFLSGLRSLWVPRKTVIAELRSTLALREETIKDLREKGRRVAADRDRWEAEAQRLQAEIAGLKTAATAVGPTPGNDANKFRELKTALVKMFHPDALGSASAFERRAREEFFKEINAEIDRIDGKRRDT